jgi:predicted outer membrane lipoprotein
MQGDGYETLSGRLTIINKTARGYRTPLAAAFTVLVYSYEIMDSRQESEEKP